MKKHKYVPNLIVKVEKKINKLLVSIHESNHEQELVDHIRQVLNRTLTSLHYGDNWVEWLIEQD